MFRGKLSKKAPKADMMEEFGKSKAKMISKDTDKDGKATGLTFDDVAGVDHIVDEFRYIISVMSEFKKLQESHDGKSRGNRPSEGFIKRNMSRIPKPDSEEYLKNPDGELDVEDDEFAEARAKLTIPKGVLFEGPPGTGKTLLAKAIAGEAGVPFFYANGSEFVEMFVGVAAKRVRDLFKRAREVSPSIIFIDELDTIGRSRALYNNRDSATLEREAGLLQLLVELDGFDTKSAAGHEQEMVLVMGATNLSSQLDPALLRSGRFERSFHVGVPKNKNTRIVSRFSRYTAGSSTFPPRGTTSGSPTRCSTVRRSSRMGTAARRSPRCSTRRPSSPCARIAISSLSRTSSVSSSATSWAFPPRRWSPDGVRTIGRWWRRVARCCGRRSSR